MLQRVAPSPARIAVRILTALLGGVLLGLLFVPLPYSFSLLNLYYLVSLVLLLLIVPAGLVALWKRRRLRLHGSLLVLVLGILLLYSAFILWPAYESGLASFAGNPNKAEEFASYHLWYIHEMPMDHTIADYMAVLIMMGTLLATWYILLPLGIVLIINLDSEWRGLQWHARWATLGVSVLAIAVPLLTWRASHQFWLWFID